MPPRTRQPYYSQHTNKNYFEHNVFERLESVVAVSAAAAAATCVSVTGYQISIINPFILLTFITRSNVVDGDAVDGSV